MKYLKGFNENTKFYSDMSDDDLLDWLEQLRLDQTDLQFKIKSIIDVLRGRKEDIEEVYSKTLPESVFDLDEKQFEFVFEHSHETTPKRHSISGKYLSQLSGVNDIGFNPNTKQLQFQISTHYFFNQEEDEYKPNKEAIKSIKFLGDRLKRDKEFYRFGIGYYFNDGGYTDSFEYYSDNQIICNRLKVNSIEEGLKILVEEDFYSKDLREW